MVGILWHKHTAKWPCYWLVRVWNGTCFLSLWFACLYLKLGLMSNIIWFKFLFCCIWSLIISISMIINKVNNLPSKYSKISSIALFNFKIFWPHFRQKRIKLLFCRVKLASWSSPYYMWSTWLASINSIGSTISRHTMPVSNLAEEALRGLCSKGF